MTLWKWLEKIDFSEIMIFESLPFIFFIQIIISCLTKNISQKTKNSDKLVYYNFI